MIRTLVVCLVFLLAACGPKAAPVSSGPASPDTSCVVRKAAHPAVEALNTPSPLFGRVSEDGARGQAVRLDKAAMGLRSWTELAPALERILEYAQSWNPDERAAEHSGIRITWGEVAASLEKLKNLLPRLDARPELLAQEFEWLSVEPGVKFTGYYSPIMRASRTRKPA